MHGAHSFGQELRWCEVGGIRISETLIPPALQLDPHAHEPGQICFVLEGEYREWTAEGAHLLRPGCIQSHEPWEQHSNSFASEEALTLLVSIDPERWVRLKAPGPFVLTARLSELAEDVRRELRRDDEASRPALEGLALLLLSTVSRKAAAAERTEPSWLLDAEEFIESRYVSALSLATVAAAVGVHRATLAAAFRRHLSISVGERIREVRVRHAVSMLRQGVPIDEVTMSTGFFDQAHLTRIFKRVTGLTPGQAQRNSRNSR
jgi:AraC-like DNA-binding protein